MRVYLDNGATTQVDDRVVEAMLPYFKVKFGNASSLHSFGEEAKDALWRSRKIISGKINAFPDEIIFTSGGSESNNLAIKGVVYANRERGNHIITTKIEHHSVDSTCKRLEKEGFEVTRIGVDNEGFVDINELKNKITDKTLVVSVIHGNNEIGTVQNIEEIGKICRKNNVYFHIDAVQSFTKERIDIKKQNIDLASFSAHKIHGPKGVGALFVRKGVKISKLIDGGPQEFGLRAGTENVAGIVGFAKAVELSEEEDYKRVCALRDYFIERVEKEIPEVKLNGPRDRRLCNNINFVFKYIEGESLLLKLNDKGIAVSTGSACSSRELKPSHVLIAIGLHPSVAHGSIRFTLSRFTTKEELDYTIETLKSAVRELRELSPLWRR